MLKNFVDKLKISNSHPLKDAALILSVGLIIVTLILTGALKTIFFQRTITVKGLVEKEVKADYAIWTITVKQIGADLAKNQIAIEKDLALIKEFLIKNGFKEEEISNANLNVIDKFSGYSYSDLKVAQAERKNERYVVESGLVVSSSNVDLVDATYRKSGDLVKKGVALDGANSPAYLFKGFNQVKNEMLEQATKNALASAKQFAKDAGDSIRGIQYANQGVFSIEPLNSQREWEDERNHILKNIRVVTTVTFLLN